MTMSKDFIVVGIVAAALAAGWVVTTAAAGRPPDVLVQDLSIEVIEAAGKRDPSDLLLIDKKLMPFVNSPRITAAVVGRHWGRATPEQKRRLQHEVKILILRECAQAVRQLHGQAVSLGTTLGSMESDREVVVRTTLTGDGADAMQLDYRLERRLSGWQVGDVRVRGVWLVESYRNAFAQQIAANGIDGLIDTLAQRNQLIDTGRVSPPSAAELRALGREHARADSTALEPVSTPSTAPAARADPPPRT